MENENINYNFTNIDKNNKYEKLNQEEREEFLIEKKVYFKRPTIGLKNRYKTEFSRRYYVNESILQEIIDFFISSKEFQNEKDNFIKDLVIDINLAIDFKEKEKIIRKAHKKNKKKVEKSDLFCQLFSLDENVGTLYDKESREYISHFIKSEMIEQYIIDKNTLFQDLSPSVKNIFTSWAEIESINGGLEFLKEELKKIDFPEKVGPSNWNKKIFISLDAQNWFFKILRDQRAINTENKANRGVFQPICSQIYETNQENSTEKKLLANNLSKKDYIIFLNNNFGTKINPKNSKLSDGLKYSDTISDSFKKYKESQLN